MTRSSTTIEDQFVGEEGKEDTQEQKYLGDIISNDGRNIKNIKFPLAPMGFLTLGSAHA